MPPVRPSPCTSGRLSRISIKRGTSSAPRPCVRRNRPLCRRCWRQHKASGNGSMAVRQCPPAGGVRAVLDPPLSPPGAHPADWRRSAAGRGVLEGGCLDPRFPAGFGESGGSWPRSAHHPGAGLACPRPARPPAQDVTRRVGGGPARGHTADVRNDTGQCARHRREKRDPHPGSAFRGRDRARANGAATAPLATSGWRCGETTGREAIGPGSSCAPAGAGPGSCQSIAEGWRASGVTWMAMKGNSGSVDITACSSSWSATSKMLTLEYRPATRHR